MKRQSTLKRALALGMSATMVGATLAGCGGSASSTAATSTETTSSAATEAEATTDSDKPFAGTTLTWYTTLNGKCWTGAYCHYFREAVLPLDPVLTASICEDGLAPDTRLCSICGRPFLPEGRQSYCSEACKAEGNRRRSRDRMRKKRDKNK